MSDFKIGSMEAKFAQLIWANQPIASGELVKLCEAELNWKKSTTYTMLRRLCQRGIFKNENSVVSALITQDEFAALQGAEFVGENFEGSLPKFLTAFTAHNKLSQKEIEEISKLIESLK